MKLALTCLLVGATALLVAQSSPKYLAYIEGYAPLAVMEMHNSGIPASITLAQGLLESGAGTSTLATQANNHFGIKCHSSWTGKSMYRKDDDRNHHGKLIESCFRSYDHPSESYADHSDFLVNGRRYAELFLLKPTDYKGWAKGLKKAGYATSKTYAHKLIEIIESYELYSFDSGDFGLAVANANVNKPATAMRDNPVAITSGSSTRQDRRPALSGASSRVSSTPAPKASTQAAVKPANRAVAQVASQEVLTRNDVKYTVAKHGENLIDIARRSKRSSRALSSYNESIASSTAALTAGTRVYLQAKRKSFRGRKKEHTVQTNETMQIIADAYAITSDALYDRNHMRAGTQPASGEEIVLRGKRKKSDKVKLQARARTSKAVASTPSSSIAPPTKRGMSASSGPARIATQPARSPVFVAEAKPVATTITVKSGDTLWSVSRQSGTSVARIKSLNGLTDNTISVGQQLIVN